MHHRIYHASGRNAFKNVAGSHSRERFPCCGLWLQFSFVFALHFNNCWTYKNLFNLRLTCDVTCTIHIFSKKKASLGGFLAQKFAVYTATSQRVQSIILCNAFTDTVVFKSMPPSKSFKYLPTFVMRRLILSNYPSHKVEAEVADSIDFMIERVSSSRRRRVQHQQHNYLFLCFF